MHKALLAVGCVIGMSLAVAGARAAIIPLNLSGTAGAGLLGGNENGPVAGGGSGGELGAGITFNDATLVLSINVGWGSSNGFTNLTGNASAGHIHGPTPSSGTAAFTENAGVMLGLDSVAGWNPSASAGGFNGTVTLNATQATDLLLGREYINIHTIANGGGEIRGYLVQVPEPTALALFGVGAVATTLRRRRKV